MCVYVMVTVTLLWTSRDWLMFSYAACIGDCSLLALLCHYLIVCYLLMMDYPGAVVHPTSVQECSDMRD